MKRIFLKSGWLILVLCVALRVFNSAAQETSRDPIESAAVKVASATVTVRILPERAAAKSSQLAAAAKREREVDRINSAPDRIDSAKESGANSDGVTICSGVSVAPGRIVTFARNNSTQAISKARVRVTLPDGEQSEARVRVVDNYSGLSLLDVDDHDVPALHLAKELPKVGSKVLTAAAEGMEGPTVSLGIIAGLNRMIGDELLPPLIQCDVRTTETSSGAAVVDKNADLIGIVVASPVAGEPAGWAYALPAHHVQRLLENRVEGKLTVLERRQATLGCTMGPGDKNGTVEVEHVAPGSPAEKAGIKKGDLVVEVENFKVRHVYQPRSVILNRQPGDRINMVVQQGRELKSVDITLGGAASGSTSAKDLENTQRRAQQNQRGVGVGPQILVRQVGPNQYGVVKQSASASGEADSENTPQSGTELKSLKGKLNSLENTVNRLQEELRERDQLQSQTGKLVNSLESQLGELRKQLDEQVDLRQDSKSRQLGAKKQAADSKPQGEAKTEATK